MVKEDFRIILAGGELRSRDGGIIGEATLDFISQFRLDFGILGISGIDSDGSLLEFDYHEVRTKRAIIENSRHVMLVVDHSKFGRNAMVNMGSISLVGCRLYRYDAASRGIAGAYRPPYSVRVVLIIVIVGPVSVSATGQSSHPVPHHFQKPLRMLYGVLTMRDAELLI
ncbi:DNA-binding transcriptional repressor GlpR [Citrobacter koseri]|uniref:DNA-binding transcriptional repressor GlpR n=1 Tax=Citrobacter koseri TaxID=545 RepID=A0A2X2YEG7_CITKO|nr:DNA-binding transcriptional repressor GlpR [Citrobacter koseri]